MDLGTFNTGGAIEVACASVREGVETGGAEVGSGAGSGIAAGRAGGALVAGAFVATRLSSPGPGMLVFVSVCARRKAGDEKKNQRTIMVDRLDLPPHKAVKKVISQSMRM
jgi:hypothetical protein